MPARRKDLDRSVRQGARRGDPRGLGDPQDEVANAPAPPEADRLALGRDGYVVAHGFIDDQRRADVLAELERLWAVEGPGAGSEFRQEPGARRLANLVDKSDVLAACVALPRLLGYVVSVIGPSLKLSSLNARSAEPENQTKQPLHADGGARPDSGGAWVCNTIWMLDDFRPDNGPLRVIPGTHLDPRLPGDVLGDPHAAHRDEVLVTGRAGDVVVLNGHLWHGGMPNQSRAPRRALHVYYCRRDKPQQQYQRSLLRPERQARLSPLQRWLCALDDPDNDRLSADGGKASGFLK